MKRMKVLFFSLFAAFIGIVLASCSATNVASSGGSPSGSHTHTFSDAWESDETGHWHKCTSCTTGISAKENHSFEVVETKESTCDTEGSIKYRCSQCGYEKSVSTEKIVHTHDEIHRSEATLVPGTTCDYVIKGEADCTECHEHIVVSEDVIKIHKYVASIDTPAKCNAAGKLKYTCSLCGDYYLQSYNDPDAHTWNDGVTENGVTTYTCTACNATKTVISAKTEVQATVDQSALAEVQTIELKNATIDLGGALDDLENSTNVSIKADKVAANTLTVSDDVKAQIGDNDVFDFSLEADGQTVSTFTDFITVTVPYTLKAGEDPNNVYIWYLDESGEPESIEATYSNGFVTFETNHFSFYTVIQLTPEKACQLFGHSYRLEKTIPATCNSEGYEIHKCSRCGDVKTVAIEKINHTWEQEEVIQATTTTEGFILYKCSHCNETKTVKIPKLPTSDNNNKFLMLYNSMLAMAEKGIKIALTNYANETQNMYASVGKNSVYSITEKESRTEAFMADLTNGKVENYSLTGNNVSVSRSTMGNGASVISSMSILLDSDVSLISALSKFVDKKILDGAWDLIFDHAFEAVDSNSGNVKYTYNPEKVKEFYTSLTEDTIEGIFNSIVGAGEYQNLVTYVQGCGTKKVSTVLDDIKAKGIDLDGLVNFFFDYMNYMEATGANFSIKQLGIKTVSDLRKLYEEYKALTVNELFDAINDMMAQMSSQSQGQTPTAQPQTPTSQGQTTPTQGQTTPTEGEGAQQQFTLSNVIEMLTQFKDMTIQEVITGFGVQFTLPTAAQLDQYLSFVTIEMELTKDYGFVSFDLTYGQTGHKTSVKVTQSDVKVSDKFNEIKENILEEAETFDVEKNVSGIVDMFKRKIGSTTLTGSVTYDSDGNGVLKITGFTQNDLKKLMEIVASKRNSKLGNVDYKKIMSATDVFIEVRFRNDSFNIRRLEELGYDISEVFRTNRKSGNITYISNSTIKLYGTVRGNISLLDDIELGYVGMNYLVYNNADNKYYGIYSDDFNTRSYIYTVVNQEDIPEAAVVEEVDQNYFDDLGDSEYFTIGSVYLKAENVYNGKITYIKRPAFIRDGKAYTFNFAHSYLYFNLFDLNNELDYTLRIDSYVSNGKTTTYLSSDDLEYDIENELMKDFIKNNYNDEYVAYCGGIFIDEWWQLHNFIYYNDVSDEFSAFHRQNIDTYSANYHYFKDFETEDGKISFKYVSVSNEDCYDVFKFKIKINDREFFVYHYVQTDNHEYTKVDEIHVGDSCEVMTLKLCSKCGKLDYDYEYDHDYKEVSRVQPTVTQYGRVDYECSVCHSNDWDIINPTYDESELIVFEDVTDLYEIEEEDVLLIGWISSRYNYYYYLRGTYNVYLCLVEVDENKNVSIVDTSDGGMVCFGDEYSYNVRGNVLCFEGISRIEAALAQLKNTDSSKNYALAVVAVETDYSGTVYALVLE